MPAPTTTDIPLRLLDSVSVASPCSMSWDDMQGDDRSRHCDQCNLNVFNLSGMTADQAETLLRTTEGRQCIRLYRRQDGTVITRDCPVGLRAARQRLVRLSLRAAAILTFILTGGYLARAGTDSTTRLSATNPVDRLCTLLRPYLPGSPIPPVVARRQVEMGERICVPRN